MVQMGRREGGRNSVCVCVCVCVCGEREKRREEKTEREGELCIRQTTIPCCESIFLSTEAPWS
jgi:hypothetical protein